MAGPKTYIAIAIGTLAATLLLLLLPHRGAGCAMTRSSAWWALWPQPSRCVAARCSAMPPDTLQHKLGWAADRGKCVPDICSGAKLSDIADFTGEAPVAYACGKRLFDRAGASQCLARKRVLLLGDSTIVELMHDFVVLLGGLGGNKTATHEYLDAATRQPMHDTTHLHVDNPSGAGAGLDITFRNAHYHMEVASPDYGIELVNKFIGYWNPAGVDLVRPLGPSPDDVLGIAALFEPRFQPQLRCLLGENGDAAACPPPDIVLVNSGLWDQRVIQEEGERTFGFGFDNGRTFESHAQRFGRRLAELRPRTRSYWVGSRAFRAFEPKFLAALGLDRLASQALPASGVPFLDLAPTMRAFMPDPADVDFTPWTGDGLHWGGIARFQGMGGSMAVSSAILQTVLNAVC